MRDNDRTLEVIVAFGVGLIAGAATALLLAPTSGHESRRRIGEFARDMGDKIRERSREAAETVRERSHDVGEKVREGTDQVVGTIKHEAERIGHALEEGKKAYQRERRP